MKVWDSLSKLKGGDIQCQSGKRVERRGAQSLCKLSKQFLTEIECKKLARTPKMREIWTG